MKKVRLTIKENSLIAANVYRLRLCGDISAITVPGQFINIEIPGRFLRRPISVCDVISYEEKGCGCLNDGWDEAGTSAAGYPQDAPDKRGETVILYKVVGAGTAELAAMPEGTELDVLTGLGNGFDLGKTAPGQQALLLGGGIGSAPMLMLAKRLKARGAKVHAVLGFNSAQDVILEDELKQAGAEVTVMTADGSYGNRGFATDAAIVKDGAYDYYYACGPGPMLKAVYKTCNDNGELSFEERMGCGFGACMGCSMQTASGPKRVCKDGPVFAKTELLWEQS
ncbi:MAG: dihydroorotate dehydrogenase electron transfer subunit [Eubacteriales bacterium]|nr:dihydroorotate dehydrogenase electron transfer subunit [Eubacteriales bacterium]